LKIDRVLKLVSSVQRVESTTAVSHIAIGGADVIVEEEDGILYSNTCRPVTENHVNAFLLA